MFVGFVFLVHDPTKNRAPGYFVAGHFVAGYFVAGHFVPGHFVAGYFVTYRKNLRIPLLNFFDSWKSSLM
jgi:hypothetical protein